MKISYITPEKPGKKFLVQVAVPDKLGKYLVHTYELSKFESAESKIKAYIKMFNEHPEAIEHFHKDNVREYLWNLERQPTDFS